MSILDWFPGGRARAERREMDAKLRQFRTEIEAARRVGDSAALTGLRDRPAQLGLSDDEADLELEWLDGLIEVQVLEQETQEGAALPIVDTSHRAVGGEPCHFVAPAARADIATDSGGKLFFTARRLVYIGSAQTTLAWAHVSSVDAAERDIVVRARPDRLLSFRCNSYVDALRGAWIATRLTKSRNAS